MRTPAAVFTIALALGAMIVVLGPGAQAAPMQITGCQHITQSGSYVLANNLPSASGPLLADGSCLLIDINLVTIDLAGFLISGKSIGKGIGGGTDVTVRNGSISDFEFGVDIADGSTAEGLRVVNSAGAGIRLSSGIVRGNSVRVTEGAPGISVTGNGGTVTGNYVTEASPGIDVASAGTVSGNTTNGNDGGGIRVGSGSTLIGNTAAGNIQFGISATCPSNLTDNTATANDTNLVLNGANCHSEDNVAP